jgi:ubiquinone biosynthesis protein Coq4
MAMELHAFPPDELPAVLRVVRTALNPGPVLADEERRFLAGYSRIVEFAIPPGDPPPLRARDFRYVGDTHRRKRLLQIASLAVLLSRPVRPESVAYLRALSARLDTYDPVIAVIEALAKGHRRRVRLLAMRRAFRVLMKEAHAAEGWMGVARFIGAMALKARVNKDRLWNYKRLGLLPEGSLGRAYWTHMTSVGFGFPGEPAGIPDAMAYHDVAHVLAGHDITPFGEIQQGSFQGGNRREDGFFFILFVILQFHQGVKITPGAPPAVGNFDPERVLWAIHRGARCHVDLTHQWNFWPLMEMPLERARERCGLLPPLAARPA